MKPQNLTPSDNKIPAEERTTPQVSYDYSIDFTEVGESSLTLPRDLKYAKFKAVGGNFLFNASYKDRENEHPGNLLSDGAGGRVKELADGDVYDLPQEDEFNTIYAELTALSDGETEAQLQIFPGAGQLNKLVAE